MLSFYLLVVCMVVGSLVSISSVDWLGVWVGLEVNLFSVVPLLVGGGSPRECESGVKYFLVQASGSILLMGGALASALGTGLFGVGVVGLMGGTVVLVGFAVKLGLVPFHFWVGGVFGGASWEVCFLLSVWQKLAPLAIVSMFLCGSLSLLGIGLGCLSSMVGGLGGIRQSDLRVLLGYSSINHAGWLMAGLVFSTTSAFVYYSLYAVISLALVYVIALAGINNHLSVLGGGEFPLLGVGLLLLTLAGLPPTLGFSMKWAVLWGIAPHSIVVCLFLVGGSLLALYFYGCLSFFLFCAAESQRANWKNAAKWTFLSALCGFLGLLLVAGVLS